jgi:hypothetical protein
MGGLIRAFRCQSRLGILKTEWRDRSLRAERESCRSELGTGNLRWDRGSERERW